MFRNALSPHRQPLLDDDQPQTPSPAKKPAAAAGLRSLFFGKDDAHNQQHRDDADEHLSASTTRHVGTASTKAQSNKIAPDAAPPKRANPRDTFQRANSHPIRLDASAALSASRTFDPSMSRAAALDVGSLTSPTQRSPGPQSRSSPMNTVTQLPLEPPSLRSTVYGSCSYVLSTVSHVLVQTMKLHHEFVDPSAGVTGMDGRSAPQVDNNTVRKAKLLYIALLEKAQKERGEWQGFAVGEPKKLAVNNDDNEQQHEDDAAAAQDVSARGVLTASLREGTKEETFSVLIELLELSFRNLRVSIVSPTPYSKHRKELEAQSLACPASLETLLSIAAFVGELTQDEKRCLLHLLSFWCALCVVDPDNQELKHMVEEKHTLVLSESSEMEFTQHASRRSAWSDLVAIDLLVVMAHYREMIFSDLEFYKIRQELRIEPQFVEPGDETLPVQAHNAVDPETSEEPAEEVAGDLCIPARTLELEDSDAPPEMCQQEPDSGGDESEIVPVVASVADDDDYPISTTSSPQQQLPSDECKRRASIAASPPSPTLSPSSTSDLENSIPSDYGAISVSPPPQAATSTAAAVTKRTPATVKSPRTNRLPKPKQHAASMVSPRFKRSRLVYPNIHAVAAAIAPAPRASTGSMPLDATLPYVAVALAAASLGVLATVAFYAARKPNH